MKELQFTCPECHTHKLDEVMSDVIQYSTIGIIEVDDNGMLAVDYAETYCENGSVDHYECGRCGYILPDVSSENDLKSFLEK